VKCDECGGALSDRSHAVFLADLGYYHPDCLQRCPCGIDWPASALKHAFGDVLLLCAGCAEAAGAA
jgi:hypothetical protein